MGGTQSLHQSHAFRSQDPMCNIQVRNHIFFGVISRFQAFSSRDGTKEHTGEKKLERTRTSGSLPNTPVFARLCSSFSRACRKFAPL